VPFMVKMLDVGRGLEGFEGARAEAEHRQRAGSHVKATKWARDPSHGGGFLPGNPFLGWQLIGWVEASDGWGAFASSEICRDAIGRSSAGGGFLKKSTPENNLPLPRSERIGKRQAWFRL